jgi:hypothetical protein
MQEAQETIMRAIGELKFYGLLDDNVHNRPNLSEIVLDTFEELRKVEVDAIDAE